eukprot:TRINITY_DN5522_c0_g1_i1.p1 TRINITY_DN5522_c0_g1~~TRINITY_DN5522_c0_g1_i1.p1  ORF type:complete len:115 (-),score=15.12 TRINITY_DN5522_c0_g1_i1:17-361(-)
MDISKLLADRVKSGWALCQETCPVCKTILVRNKEKQTYCVSCKIWAVREKSLQLDQDQKPIVPNDVSQMYPREPKLVSLFDNPSFEQRFREMQGEIGRAVQQECRDRSRMPSSA